MSLSVFNWILVTLSTCSEKILLDPCRVLLEYIEIEQGKKKGSTCMVHILISTLVEHLHVGSIIVHYMYTTDQIRIFLWGIFHSTLFILWWLPTSLLAWINPPWGRRPNRAGAPMRLAPAAPPPADKQKMEKDKLLTSKWFNNLFANRKHNSSSYFKFGHNNKLQNSVFFFFLKISFARCKVLSWTCMANVWLEKTRQFKFFGSLPSLTVCFHPHS